MQYGNSWKSISSENLFKPSNKKGIEGVILSQVLGQAGIVAARNSSLSERLCKSYATKLRRTCEGFSFIVDMRKCREACSQAQLLRALAVAYLYPSQSENRAWCRLQINHEQGEEAHGSTTRVDLLPARKQNFIFYFHFFFYLYSFFQTLENWLQMDFNAEEEVKIKDTRQQIRR